MLIVIIKIEMEILMILFFIILSILFGLSFVKLLSLTLLIHKILWLNKIIF